MATRKIVKIDEEKCTGCGQCVPGCAEGALAIVDGKARLVKESYCDGLGACLGECPAGAITVEERSADSFDEQAVKVHLAARTAHAGHVPGQGAARATTGAAGHAASVHGGCPGARLMQFAAATPAEKSGATTGGASAASPPPSALGHWPVQLALLPTEAPFYADAELVLAADCAAYALADFHERFTRGRALAIACPKLDDVGPYVEKLAEILRRNTIRGLVLVHMEVPCCGGIVFMAEQAAELCGRPVPVRDVTIGLRGQILRDKMAVFGAVERGQRG